MRKKDELSKAQTCMATAHPEEMTAGAKNGQQVRALTDECAAKGIILVPGGENL